MIDSADVTDQAAESRFELAVDDHVAFAAYTLEGDTIVFTHTVVPAELEGRGVASALIKGALAQARAEDLKIVSTCSFVTAYLERHPEEGN